MKLDIRHTFACTPQRFWEMYWDDALDEMMRESSKLQRELVEERTEGEIAVRRLRFIPDKELPAAAARLVGAKKLIYEQENRYDAARGVLDWRMLPTVLSGKLDAAGSLRVEPRGEADCEQVVTGDIRVNVPFIGGQIERAVLAEVQRGWDRAAETYRAWLTRFGS